MDAYSQPTPPESRTRRSQQTTVLVVEDDPGVRELVAAVLKRSGYLVLKARHSTEALHFHQEYDGSIHLLVTDLSMEPHLNGLQLAGLFRHGRPGIPVLYISGYVDDDRLMQEVENGQALFLSKPFTTDSLLETVRLALGESIASGEPS